ncbi:MAG: hypothetical protein ACRDT0_14140 [Pseudonocardiaceae bacterium]
MAIDAATSAFVAESRRKQGLPPKITDPAIIERVVAVFRLIEPRYDDNVRQLPLPAGQRHDNHEQKRDAPINAA